MKLSGWVICNVTSVLCLLILAFVFRSEDNSSASRSLALAANVCPDDTKCGGIFLGRRYKTCNPMTGHERCNRFLGEDYVCGPCQQQQESQEPTQVQSQSPSFPRPSSSLPPLTPTSSPATPLPPRPNCPKVGASATLDYVEGTDLFLPLTENIRGLCTLYLVAESGARIPIARAYNRNEWESYGNSYASVNCSASGCVTKLPAVSSISKTAYGNYSYMLTRYSHSIASKDQCARFLEQATFGPTQSELSHCNSSYADWILSQERTPYSSHRGEFRRNLNHRFMFPTFMGRVTHPCEAGARYRKAAFSDKDYALARRHESNFVTIKTHGCCRKVFSMFGQNRTVITVLNATSLTHGGSVNPIKDASYRICVRPLNSVGTFFKIEVPPYIACTDVYADGVKIGIPPVQFDDEIEPEHLVRLDGVATVVSAEEIVLSAGLSGDQCNATWMLTDQSNAVMIGLFNGSHYIHDPRFVIEDNTLEHPRLDALGPLVSATNTDKYQREKHVKCSNVAMHFLNEDWCRLSNSTTAACSRSGASDGEEFVVVCGSLDEVGNDPGDKPVIFDSVTSTNRTSSLLKLQRQKESIWLHTALSAPDQLRQRVAWVLYQILVVSPNAFDTAAFTEPFLSYYDIFVRNALGNYRNVLKEVIYSPMMATMLSYRDSKSTQYIWRKFQRVEYPDENFAREVMQLFSIGLHHLNIDGTRQLDEKGKPFLTYTNSIIEEFARLFTGFKHAAARGNVEAGIDDSNWIDSLEISHETRDVLPKMGLNGKYIGDGVPPCRDRPDKAFLLKGAVYRLLGSFPSPNWIFERESWASDADVKRLSLNRTSNLYAKLCKPDETSTCTFPPKVVLEENLECVETECRIEAPRVIQVEDGVYYEYNHAPCVREAFLESPGRTMSGWTYAYVCEDPVLAAGQVLCCNRQDNTYVPPSPYDFETSRFDGERTSRDEAEKRCRDVGLGLCNGPPCLTCDSGAIWTSRSWECVIKVKIGREGRIAIVHNTSIIYGRSISHNVANTTNTFFQAEWTTGSITDFLVDYEGQCETFGCDMNAYDDLCICPTSVSKTQVFYSVPTREKVLTNLKIGSFPPDMFGDEVKESNMSTPDVQVFLRGGDDTLSANSTFRVVDDYGVIRYLKNEKSVVTVGSSDLSFRNPPHFMSLSDPERLDAEYEVEEGLNQYFYHKNTAPFLSKQFAQRFGLSNPSPRLVTVASIAFRQGKYMDNESGKEIGSGQYGDLLAMVSAILLDRESRSVVLDADPAQGSLKEPLLRVVRIMRSLGFQPNEDKPFVELRDSLQDGIGQQAQKIPNVFGFFLPEFSPAGPIGDAMMACPECQVLDGPKTIELMNGLMSLVKYGLDFVGGGFGFGLADDPDLRRLGEFKYATGSLGYAPSANATSDIVDELSTLLVAGRLDIQKKNDIVRIHDLIMNQTVSELGQPFSTAQSAILIQQLIVLTPEFHTTGVRPNPTTSSTYKAVVFIMLPGGFDSFNMLVPHSCTGTNAAGATTLEQYNAERGELAFDDIERDVIIDAEGQPCSKFALHDELPFLRDLYNESELMFLANTGVLDEAGVNRVNYVQLTNLQLFAHNWMRRAVQRLDPDKMLDGTGLLGRMATILRNKSYNVSAVSIDDPSISVVPEPGARPLPRVVPRGDVATFDEKPKERTIKTPGDYLEFWSPRNHLEQLNGDSPAECPSFFGQTWCEQLMKSIPEADKLKEALDATELGSGWPSPLSSNVERLAMVSRLINARNTRGVNKDLFFTNFGSWDHHAKMKSSLRSSFHELNQGLHALVDELKAQGVWDDVTIVVASEFGRTLTANTGHGSDHGWGGNYMMMGGQVRGGQILGHYPDDLTRNGPLNIGRGRLIPTTSWDAIWNGIVQWMEDLTDEELDYVLPNRHVSTGNGFTDLKMVEDLYYV